jgi:hypothetical protein
MPHHHTAFNFLLAAALTSMPWWVTVFETSSMFAAKILPIIGVMVGLLQLWILVRKFLRK